MMDLGETVRFLFKLALWCLIIGIVLGVVLSGRFAHSLAEMMHALMPSLGG